MDIGFDGSDSQLRDVNFEDNTVIAISRTLSSNDFLYKFELINSNEYDFEIITFRNRKKELKKEVNLYENDIDFKYTSVDDLSLQAIENVLIARGWTGDTVESEPVDDAPAIVIPLIDTVEEIVSMREYFSFLEVCQEYATAHEKPVILTVIDELPHKKYCESYIDILFDIEFKLESVEKSFYINIAKNRTGSTSNEVLKVDITDNIQLDSSRNI